MAKHRAFTVVASLMITLAPSGGSSQPTESGGLVVPVPASEFFESFQWTGEQMTYPDPTSAEEVKEAGNVYDIWFSQAGPAIRGDTYPMTWADDDEIYASSGDPHWGEKATGLDLEKFSGFPPNYRITKVNDMHGFEGNGGDGVKPSGLICVDGVLFLAVQNLLGKKPPARGERSQHGTDAAIFRSLDHGLTWEPDIRKAKPMFPGNAFGGPAFVNFGRNNQHARDGFVYAVSADQWDNGSKLRLGRVPKDRILEVEAWEWVSQLREGTTPVWSSNLSNAVPILRIDRGVSLPEMVYLHDAGRYLLLSWHLKADFSNSHGSELLLFDAPQPWGPFTLVFHDKNWESSDISPYAPRMPLKWLKHSEDEVEGWIQFSGSWRENSPHYRSHVRPFRLTISRRSKHGSSVE